MLLNATIPLSVDFDTPEDFLIFIFHILFATSSVLLAGSVVIGISSTRCLRGQNRFIFMLNTSISDTLTGFSVYYLGLFDVQEGYPSRNGTFYILPSFLGVNVLTFLFAQFDRYFAVCHPFFYNRFITRSVVFGICVFCWVYTYTILTVQNMVPISKAAQINAFGVMTLQIIVLVKVLMTVKLYIIARSHLVREAPSAERENKKESLRIIVFVVICFLALWCPSFVNIIVRQLTRKGLRFRNEATNLFAIMARLNALVTPALYIWGESFAEGGRVEECVEESVLQEEGQSWLYIQRTHKQIYNEAATTIINILMKNLLSSNTVRSSTSWKNVIQFNERGDWGRLAHGLSACSFIMFTYFMPWSFLS